jgi:hypothetical protein
MDSAMQAYMALCKADIYATLTPNMRSERKEMMGHVVEVSPNDFARAFTILSRLLNETNLGDAK